MSKLFSIGCILLCLVNSNSYAKMSNSNSKYISVAKNINLWIKTYGNPTDEACLFASGAGANSTFWSENLCQSLANKGFYVIVYDHRDFGYSSKIDYDKNPYEFSALVKDAVCILDSLHIKKAHIIGHSMGGFIAQLLALDYPERVLSITSTSASTNSPEVPPPPDKTWEIFMETSPSNNYDNDLHGFLMVWKYLNGTANFDAHLAIEYTKNLYERQDIIGALGASHVKAQATLKDRTDLLKNINIPALIIHGEEDYLVDVFGGIQTAECIKGAELLIIPKMGHLPFNTEILQQYEQGIINFLLKHKK